MIDLVFTGNKNIIKKANEFFESLFYGMEIEEDDKILLNGLFQEHLLLVETEKCKKVYLDLYCWTRDDFLHSNLSVLHQYCFYHLLSYEAEVQRDENGGGVVDTDEIDDTDLLFNLNIDNAELYIEYFFEDLDFLEYDIFYSTYNTLFAYSAGFDFGLHELLPRDLRAEIKKNEEEQKELVGKRTYTCEEDFLYVIDSLLKSFSRKVSDNKAYELLWDEHKKRNERYAQILLRMFVDSYCDFYGLDSSCEVDTGRGCVDFKISFGCFKVLIEVKNQTNMVKKGINDQLLTYLKASKIKHGILIVFIYSDEEMVRIKRLKKNDFSHRGDYILRLIDIDEKKKKKTGSKL